MQRDHYHIDKKHVRRSFDRAAYTYDAAAILQQQVRDEMLSRLDFVNVQPKYILDAGCGTGVGTLALMKRFKAAHVLSMDLATSMLNMTRQRLPIWKKWLSPSGLLCGDIEQLPLKEDSVDIYWSNLAMQWCNDLDQVFSEARRVIQPGGLFMFSTFGPDTLKELRASTHNDHTHVSRFIDMHDIGDALTRTGFSAPVLDVVHYTLTYPDVIAVMRDLKAIGAHNATVGRPRGLLGRGFLNHLAEQYEAYRHDGRLPATYEVIYGHAWSPKAQPSIQEGYAPVTFVAKKASRA